MKKFKVKYYEIEIKDHKEYNVVKEEEIQANGFTYGHKDICFFGDNSTNVAYFSDVIIVKEIQ